MADELVALFSNLQTTDREDLVAKFALVMQTDHNTSRFFLESSNWNVETAVNTFLTATHGMGTGDSAFRDQAMASAPEAALVSDLSEFQRTKFPPGVPVDVHWEFRNTGREPWPVETRLVHGEGATLGGPKELVLGTPLPPGQTIGVDVRLVAPAEPGEHAGCWRMTAPTGYFGEPVWLIMTVGHDGTAAAGGGLMPAGPPPAGVGPGAQQGVDEEEDE